MNNFNEVPTIENRYEIQDLHIFDTKNGKSIYIREILDFGSHEFNSSDLTAEKRLDIIANVGLNSLTNVLTEYYKIRGYSDTALFDGYFVLRTVLTQIYPNFRFHLELPSDENPNFALRLTALK